MPAAPLKVLESRRLVQELSFSTEDILLRTALPPSWRSECGVGREARRRLQSHRLNGKKRSSFLCENRKMGD